jgi:hypothetical protein
VYKSAEQFDRLPELLEKAKIVNKSDADEEECEARNKKKKKSLVLSDIIHQLLDARANSVKSGQGDSRAREKL